MCCSQCAGDTIQLLCFPHPSLKLSRTRSHSPVTVEEWVAALPEEGAGGEEDERQERQEMGGGEEEDEDTLSLGAEAVLQLVENSQEEQLRPSAERYEICGRKTSATSLISSCCSRESLLQSREPDPEQVNSSSTTLAGAVGPWLWWWPGFRHLDPATVSCCTF